MSGKAEQPKEEKKDEAAAISVVKPEAESRPRRICITCGLKPTISESNPYCPSCMRKKSIESREGKKAPVQAQQERMKKDTSHHEKTPTIENTAVNIDFGDHPLILKKVRDLADQEIRPLELQIIYLLKRHFETGKMSLMED